MTTLKYPISFSNGSLVLVSDDLKLIPQVIAHILQTKTEERVLRPDFGITDTEFNIVSSLPKLLRSLESSLAEGLQEYPGVSVRLVAYLDDSGQIPITCYWDFDEQSGEVEVVI